MSVPSSVGTCSGSSLFTNAGNLSLLSQQELEDLRRDANAYSTDITTLINNRRFAITDPASNTAEALNDQELSAQITQIQNLIRDLETEISQETGYATDLRAGIEQRLTQLQQQEADLQQKQQLIRTRDRMLQIAMEKNIYKRKLIYVLISVILVIIVFLMLGYVAYRRMGGSNLVKNLNRGL